MRAASLPRQIERENEMIVISQPLFVLQDSEDSAFPVSSLKALPRNLSCTRVITTGVLGGRLNTSRFSSSNIQRFPACKGDPSAALGMTVGGSSLSVSLVTSHSSLIPAFKFRGSGDSAFPVSSFRAKSRNLSCTPDITAGALGGRLNILVSRHQTSGIFLSARGIPWLRNAIKLSGRTFLAPHRGSSPKGRGGYVAVLHESVEISIASDYST